MSLFARLKEAAGDAWGAYVDHAFVRRLGDGTLPEAAFRRYLIQDWLFLKNFARAWALAAAKAERLEDIRDALAAASAIVETEMALHVRFCAGWGLAEADIEAAEEAPETTAYTAYVLERGYSGDLLDLHVALAPCVVGYAEIGARLAQTMDDANPYAPWAREYASEAYQAVAERARARLDALADAPSQRRFASLARVFTQATRLEAGFWDMGLAGA